MKILPLAESNEFFSFEQKIFKDYETMAKSKKRLILKLIGFHSFDRHYQRSALQMGGLELCNTIRAV